MLKIIKNKQNIDMANETIDYEKLVKAKYPDAILDYIFFNGGVAYYADIAIKNTVFLSNYYDNCTKKEAWEQVHNELSQKNLI